jgi:curved DNA-binding protein CbpA
MVALRQAYETLSDNTAKAIYDARLRGPAMPDAWVGAGAGAVSVEVDAAGKPRKETNWPAVGIWLLLGLAGVWLIAQVSYVFLVSRYITASPPPAAAEARDKAVIQDYYQETGVRAASAAEVEMLRLADRKAERERRQEEQAVREQEQAERDYERFIADSKRLGERVSADLQSAERERQYAEEREKREAEAAARRREQEEAERVERERQKWRAVLNERPSQSE